ncbi:hypothetical protein LCGC14_0657470 [marine sediment metagenome]|uniref:Methyltransferase type 11 domain-containing protein n=1 Tax=marine sediment metagenome TaxID=412755 RepID=A0A0F9QZM7_9ZZZZ
MHRVVFGAGTPAKTPPDVLSCFTAKKCVLLGDEDDPNFGFKAWRYSEGDTLPFDSDSVSFIFSEHFLEHLTVEEVAPFIVECSRILAPGGVIRSVVPDADLRKDIPPEPAGYPGHKSRWTVFLLADVLKAAGLVPVLLKYWDNDGQRHDQFQAIEEAYTGLSVTDTDMVFSAAYLKRPNSLIVDGLSPGKA